MCLHNTKWNWSLKQFYWELICAGNFNISLFDAAIRKSSTYLDVFDGLDLKQITDNSTENLEYGSFTYWWINGLWGAYD